MHCYIHHFFYNSKYQIFMMKEEIQFSNGKCKDIIQLNSFEPQIKWQINDNSGNLQFQLYQNGQWKKFNIESSQGKLLKQFLSGKISYCGINDSYKIVRYITHKTFCSIVRMRSTLTEELVTGKIFKRRKGYCDTEFRNEVKTLQHLKHNNINHMKEYYGEDHHNYIIYDLVEGSSLEKYIKKRHLNLEQINKITKDLMDTINFIHSEGYSHEAIKLENIFYCSIMNQLTLVDFSQAKEFYSQSDEKRINSFNYNSLASTRDFEFTSHLKTSLPTSPTGLKINKDYFDCGLVYYQLIAEKVLTPDEIPSINEHHKIQKLILDIPDKKNAQFLTKLFYKTESTHSSPLILSEFESLSKIQF